MGRLLIGCCICISVAMPSRLVKMLFCLSMIESKDEVLELLKIFL